MRDAAVVLPAAVIFLFLPPFILIFTAPVHVVGIPLIVFYVFGVWAAAVVCAWIIARRLAPAGAADIPAQPESVDAAARRDAD